MKIYKMILNNLSQKYFSHVEVLLSVQTMRTNKAYYNKHIKDTLGLMEVKAITFLDLQDFVNSLIKRDYKIKTVKNILSILKTMFKFARKLRIISYDCTQDVDLPRFDNKRYFTFPLVVQKDFIRSLIDFDEYMYSDIFFFLLHGRRRNEVLSLTWDLVDFEQNLYYVPARINKAKRNMSYMMTDELHKRLYKHYLIACIDQNIKYPKGFVFQNPRTHTRFKDLRKAWKRFLTKYNLPYIKLHDIRHLLGTYSINFLSLPIEHVSYALGHTSIEITQKYITIKPEISREVINKVFESL